MAILSYAEAIVRYPDLASHPQSLIQALLAAAEELIVAHVGPGAPTYDEPTAINELITHHGGDLLMLGRPALEILSVLEGPTPTTLSADDYEIRSSGTTLRRLNTGTHPRTRWYGRADITYVPLSDAARREVAQLSLVRLFLDYSPGVQSERIGEWSETFASANARFREDRDAILSTLSPVTAGIW